MAELPSEVKRFLSEAGKKGGKNSMKSSERARQLQAKSVEARRRNKLLRERSHE